MHTLKKVILIYLLNGVLLSCSNDEEAPPVTTQPPPSPTEIAAPKVGSIRLDDITNNGNGTDLEIRFEKVSNETLVSEYRIFVVQSDDKSTFDLSSAEVVANDNYEMLLPDGRDKKHLLNESSTDIKGEVIVEDVEYLVFVLSVADGTNAVNNTLSNASNSITLTQTTIEITYIGNDGVMISDGEKKVIVDALPGNLSGWNPIANGVQPSIEGGTPPYDNIKAAMFTHAHSDHVSFTSVNTFLNANTSVALLAPPQVTAGINGSSSQIADLNLALHTHKDTVISGIPIRIVRIKHFIPQDGSNFNNVENYIFLIELGGKKILHIGDGDLSATNFSSLGLENEGIDVALIPTFNFSGQLTTTNRDVLLSMVAPKNIIGLHLFSSTPIAAVKAFYPNAIVFTKSLETVRF